MAERAIPFPQPVQLPTKLTRDQITGFWAAWTGWTLDGMDSVIYALVLSPALTELLPKSGMSNAPANVGLCRLHSVRAISHRMGTGLHLGTHCRPLRPHAGTCRHHPRLCRIHRRRRVVAECLGACNFPPLGRHGNRRRVGAGGNLRCRSVARGPARNGSRLFADRLLRGILSCRRPQLHRRRAFRLAGHVPVRPGSGYRLTPDHSSGQGTGALAAHRKNCAH